MSDESLRMMELSLEGFGCSQITMILGLEAQGKTNPDLVRAVSGLHGGLGFSGKLCGALSGGCCLLAMYAGRGTPEETEDSRLPQMIRELVEWFENEYKPRFGGIDCAEILQGIASCNEYVHEAKHQCGRSRWRILLPDAGI
jgi:C_GCAxxG_C_C family probable redox protein